MTDTLTPAFVSLDPWTVYGDLVGGGGTSPARISVPDIGILPPTGRYLGTVRCDGDPMPAHLTVTPRHPDIRDGIRWLHVELEAPVPLASPVAVVFEAMEL